jgi:5-methyltetrahydrofolate--homocysteine methyltransferase
MQRKYTNRSFLDAVKERVLIYDGAMGTSLQKLDLTAKDFGGEIYFGCNDFLVISHPEAVEKVHRSFLEVGVDVLETDTFRSNRITLAEYGLQDRVVEINKKAAELAKNLADEFSKSTLHKRFVAGSIGPSGKLPSMEDPELSNIQFGELVAVFQEQAKGLIAGGVDVLLIETSQDILEVKACILGIQQAFEETGIYLPIQAQVTLDTTGRMLLGTDIAAALAILEDLPIDIIGLNCSTGPEHMREPISFLGENSNLPVSCIPNAGLPLNVDGEAVYPLSPIEFADTLSEFIEKYQISVVGGCCGTTPLHLKELVEKVGGKKHPPRPIIQRAQLASAIQVMNMQQEPPPFLIGERLNTQGSKIFKKIILDQDYERVLGIAQQQVDGGAHGLDICVALTERADEVETIRRVIKKIAPNIKVPLVIDSTELDVMEMALQTAPGRCMINSTHFESGREKADKVFQLAKKYNAAVLVLTIDEAGMAKTAQRKLEISKRLVDVAVNEHGLSPSDLVIDALTFTLATGDPEFNLSAQETIEGIRLIKENIPGVLTSLGVSNVSFGLSPAARAVLNSVMLYHSVQAGLDMAIVNPVHITPYLEISEEERKLAEDLIFYRNETALQDLIGYYEKNNAKSGEKDSKQDVLLKSMTPEERLHWSIVHRKKEGVEKDIDALIESRGDISSSDRAVEILNNVLLPAMKDVGDKFGTGELILPFVLQSAEVMKKSVAHLENYLEKKEGVSKGLMVLATVYGDVHDIGKNLVKTILTNNGYDVIDLGKQVPAETIISKAFESKANAIGLSALLVSTSKQMPLIVNELQRRNAKIPVLIGGAAINRRFGRRILMTDSNEYYQGGVFYCKDAFEGLSTMDQIMNSSEFDNLMEKMIKESDMELGRILEGGNENLTQVMKRSKIQISEQIPSVPAWGPKVVQSMPLEAVFEHLSLNELFRLSWGAKNTHGDEWKKLKIDFEARLAKMKKDAKHNEWLNPKAVYGYFPVQSSGNDLLVYDQNTLNNSEPKVLEVFNFPRQSDGENLSLADYFAPVESGRMDVVALQVVTVGDKATERFEKLQASGNYTEAYFTHGLAVQTAEATADYLHNHIRRELGLKKEQGKRYSWGYASIPDLNDHEKVFRLLPVEQELKMHLTSAFQLVPEQSTAAIILHHPLAKYFNIGTSRVDQLMKESKK